MTDAIKNSYLLILAVLILGCQKTSSNQDYEIIKQENLKPFISEDTDFLATPVSVDSHSDKKFAVLDPDLGEVVVFDGKGEKLFTFGGYGKGPGEWGKASAANMSFSMNKEQFMISDPGRYMIHIYNSEGKSIKSYKFKEYLGGQDKELLSSDTLLVASNGHNDGLAQIVKVSEDFEPIKSIGKPAADPISDVNMNIMYETGMKLADGELPEAIMNEALVAGNESDIALVLTTMGEVRFYNKNSDLIWSKALPEYITKPLWEKTIKKNKEVESDAAVYSPLKFATSIEIIHNKIFVLTMGTKDMEDDIDQYLLVYTINGELEKSYRFDQEESPLALTDMTVVQNDGVYMTDIANARIVKFTME